MAASRRKPWDKYCSVLKPKDLDYAGATKAGKGDERFVVRVLTPGPVPPTPSAPPCQSSRPMAQDLPLQNTSQTSQTQLTDTRLAGRACAPALTRTQCAQIRILSAYHYQSDDEIAAQVGCSAADVAAVIRRADYAFSEELLRDDYRCVSEAFVRAYPPPRLQVAADGGQGAGAHGAASLVLRSACQASPVYRDNSKQDLRSSPSQRTLISPSHPHPQRCLQQEHIVGPVLVGRKSQHLQSLEY